MSTHCPNRMELTESNGLPLHGRKTLCMLLNLLCLPFYLPPNQDYTSTPYFHRRPIHPGMCSANESDFLSFFLPSSSVGSKSCWRLSSSWYLLCCDVADESDSASVFLPSLVELEACLYLSSRCFDQRLDDVLRRLGDSSYRYINLVRCRRLNDS